MRKMPTLFVRDFTKPNAPVTDQVNSVCAWVFNDPDNVTACVKIDGTCTFLDEEGAWWARREVKPGKKIPDGFQPIETDNITGKMFGWEPMAASPFAKFHAEAVAVGDAHHSGTYELIGPKINGNPEGAERHMLISHDRETTQITPVPLGVAETKAILDDLKSVGREGIVFTHADGRRAKIKVRDFV